MVEKFEFDVFLSHNSQDKAEVLDLAQQLKSKGVRVWLDAWELAPGSAWQEELERAIEKTKSAAVLVGASGIGPWQNEEMRAFIMSFVRRGCPVIPVLLPNAPSRIALPLFLNQFTWVDLRDGIRPDGLSRLIWGITGKQPDGNAAPVILPDEGGKSLLLEEVFCTSGLPAYTYVEPSIYLQVASDLRQHGKHVLVAGPSGSGKTCLVFRLLRELGLAARRDYEYISALQKNADKLVLDAVEAALASPSKKLVIVDDFHLLKRLTRIAVGTGLKHLADLAFAQPAVQKFVLIGISSSPEGLLVNAPDLGPRLGVYRMPLAPSIDLLNIVRRGEKRLSIEFANADGIVMEACGSHFICQFLCKEICLENRVNRTAESITMLEYDIGSVRSHVISQLAIRFKPMLSAFIMSNGSSFEQSMPLLAFIVAISGIPKSLITLDEVASVAGEFGDLIRAIKTNIPTLIQKCVPEGKFSKYLYWERDSDLASIEDPVFRYFLNHLDARGLMESLGIPRTKQSRLMEVRDAAVNRYAPDLRLRIAEEPRRHSIFISYSHQDQGWQQVIQAHLKPIASGHDLSVWSDLRITAGSDWQQELEHAISRATIAILLVSPGFLASDFLMSQEVPALLDKAARGGLDVIWVPISACAFERTALAQYQAAWNPRRPLDSLRVPERNRALAEIARSIRRRIGWKALALHQSHPAVWTARLDDRDLEGTRLLLRIGASAGHDEFAPKLLREMKISSADDIDRLVALSLPGIAVQPRVDAPPGIPYRAGSQLFEFERRGPHWDAIARTKSIGLFIPSELLHVPPELFILRS